MTSTHTATCDYCGQAIQWKTEDWEPTDTGAPYDEHGRWCCDDCDSGERHVTSVEQHEIEAWLGDDWDPTRRTAVVDTILAWETDHPDADDTERDAAWTALAQQADGVLDLDGMRRADIAARSAAAEARIRLRTAVEAVVADGMSEAEAARQSGVTRMTIRSWLGK